MTSGDVTKHLTMNHKDNHQEYIENLYAPNINCIHIVLRQDYNCCINVCHKRITQFNWVTFKHLIQMLTCGEDATTTCIRRKMIQGKNLQEDQKMGVEIPEEWVQDVPGVQSVHMGIRGQEV